MIIRNARIVSLDGENRVFDSGAVQVCADGSVGAVGADLPASNGEPVMDAGGRLLMPALINGHTHLYSTLARGMKLGGRPPANFPEILKKVWWRLDTALDEEDIYYSALVGLMDSAKAGVATLIDHHSSPNACGGSLDVIERAFRQVGLRGALCYETSDRNGRARALEAMGENVRFIEKIRRGEDGTIAANFGLHASFTLSDRTLRSCVEANRALGAGFHIHVAEDACDVQHAQERFQKSPVRRLCDLGVLDGKAIAAHCVHVSAADIARLAEGGVNVVHNPQSNLNNGVGTMRLSEFLRTGMPVGLGSDGFSPRMWEEFLMAYHGARMPRRTPRPGGMEAWSALLNNREIARKAWGWELGRIAVGARADLMLVDYFPPTPLTGTNLFGHVLFGIAHAAVDSLMVNGKFVVRERRCVNVDEPAISERATARARKLWERLL